MQLSCCRLRGRRACGLTFAKLSDLLQTQVALKEVELLFIYSQAAFYTHTEFYIYKFHSNC